MSQVRALFRPSEVVGELVQLVRTPACHAGGHGFKSRTPRWKMSPQVDETRTLFHFYKSGVTRGVTRRARNLAQLEDSSFSNSEALLADLGAKRLPRKRRVDIHDVARVVRMRQLLRLALAARNEFPPGLGPSGRSSSLTLRTWSLWAADFFGRTKAEQIVTPWTFPDLS